jgi:hypothetical protein
MFAYSDIDIGVVEFYGCQLIMADEPEEATDKFNDNISVWAEDNGYGFEDYEVTQTHAIEVIPLTDDTFSQGLTSFIMGTKRAWHPGTEVLVKKCGACWHKVPDGLTFKEVQNWQVANRAVGDAHAELMRQQPDDIDDDVS